MTRLEVLRAANAAVGLVAEIDTVPTELDCPVHETPLLLQRLDTLNGWQGVIVCPAFDGSCRYDPDGHPGPIDAPEEAPQATEDTASRSTGGF